MTKQEIGAILMGLREKSGKSREEVSELLGKSIKTIGHWETGYAQPDANTLFLLCTIYEADLNDAFGYSPKYIEKPAPLSEDGLSAAKRATIEKIKQMDDAQVEALGQIAESILRLREK